MDILVILTVIFCSGYFFSITLIGTTLTIAFLAGCSLLIICRGIVERSHGLRDSLLVDRRLFLWIAYLVVLTLVTSGISTISIKQTVLYFCAMLIVSRYDWPTFKRTYIKTMVVISIMALIGFILQYTPIINSLPTVTNYNGTVYVNGIVFSIIKYAYSGLTKRLHGLFWEPGLFATYLAIAIVFLRKEYTERYWLTLVLFGFCLIMTKSGAGIAMIPLILGIKLTESLDDELSTRKSMLLCIMLFFLFAVGQSGSGVIEQWLNDYLFVKLNDTSNISNFTRTNAIYVDLMIAWNHFPIGTGLANYASEVARYNSTLQSSGTSTITTYLAEYGIFGIPVVCLWGKAISGISESRRFVTKFATVLMFLSILTKEPHGNLLFMNCLLLYSIAGYDSHKGEIKNNSI